MVFYLEIVIAGVEDDAHVVDVGVQVVEKLPVVDMCQLVTNLWCEYISYGYDL